MYNPQTRNNLLRETNYYFFFQIIGVICPINEYMFLQKLGMSRIKPSHERQEINPYQLSYLIALRNKLLSCPTYVNILVKKIKTDRTGLSSLVKNTPHSSYRSASQMSFDIIVTCLPCIAHNLALS